MIVNGCLLLDKSEDAFFVADNDVRLAVLVEVTCGDLAANAGVVVDEMGREFHGAVLLSSSTKPIENGGVMRAWISAVVGVVALAGNDVLNAIAIDIDAGHGVWL